MSDRLLLLAPLAVGLLVCVGALAMALRALAVERREGLNPSYRRLGLMIAINLAAALLTAWAVWSTRARPAPAPAAVKPGPSAAPDPAKKATIDAKKAELEQARTVVKNLEAELAVLEPGSAVTPAPAGEAPPPPVWPVLVMALFAVGAAAVLLLDGDVADLLPWRRRARAREAAARAKSGTLDQPAVVRENAMAALAQAVEQWRWADALAAARRVHGDDLGKLELLDYLYLRAFAAVGEALALTAPGQPAAAPQGHEPRKAGLEQARADLTRMLDLAPRSGEARYLKARVDSLLGDFQLALDGFRAAKPELAKLDLPVAHEESVCLLRLAEARLGAADSDGAGRLFDEVTKLGVLAHQIPVALITHRLLQVQAAVQAGKLDEARTGLAAVRQVEGLGESEQRTAEVTCDVYELLIHHRAGQHADTQASVRAFLSKWLPAGLPPVDDQSADEYLFPAVEADKLLLPAQLYRGFYFVLAVTLAEETGRRGRAPEAAETTALAEPLLRALQFEPRQREALAALGVLYYWFRPEKQRKAIEWLEAAVALGVRSRTVRDLLARDRRLESERTELLDIFRDASARFLGDAMVSPRVRKALAEELGRFQDFQPILMELDAAPLDLEPRAPTVASLRERARFVLGLAGEVFARRAAPGLGTAAAEFQRVVEALEVDAGRVEELERRVMEEVGKVVLR